MIPLAKRLLALATDQTTTEEERRTAAVQFARVMRENPSEPAEEIEVFRAPEWSPPAQSVPVPVQHVPKIQLKTTRFGFSIIDVEVDKEPDVHFVEDALRIIAKHWSYMDRHGTKYCVECGAQATSSMSEEHTPTCAIKTLMLDVKLVGIEF